MGKRTCGHVVIDIDGNEEPCGRNATGWRWYQDCGHEDTLDVACDWHSNESGRLIHGLRHVLGQYFDFDVDSWDEGACPEPEDVWRLHRDLRAVLAGGA